MYNAMALYYLYIDFALIWVFFFKERTWNSAYETSVLLFVTQTSCLFSLQGYYYFAIVEDLILRFGWALNLSLTTMGYVHGDIMICVLSPLEVFRFVLLKCLIVWHGRSFKFLKTKC
jgi:hypothetical protein